MEAGRFASLVPPLVLCEDSLLRGRQIRGKERGGFLKHLKGV